MALKGPNFDGHDYVAAAFASGAGAAVVGHGFPRDHEKLGCLFPVHDTLHALGDLAGAWRREHSTLVAAVTGSNGKTTTKEMLSAILERRHRVLKNQGNFNNLIGLPLTLLGLSEEHTACVAEMGMNAPGEIARLTEIAAPEAGVITNVGPAHLGPMGSIEAVAQAKTELFRGLSPAATAVVNLDDPLLAPWVGKLECRVLTFGGQAGADLKLRDLKLEGERTRFILELPSGEAVAVDLPAPGEHNAQDALAAAACALALGQGAEAIAEGLAAFKPVAGRLALKSTPSGVRLLDDTYNANPASVAAGLKALKALAGGGRMVLILGDMRELGPTSPRLHRQAGQLAGELGCGLVLAVGEHAAQVAKGAGQAGLNSGKALAFGEMDELLAEAKAMLREGDVVLIKGSRSSRMERVVAALSDEETA